MDPGEILTYIEKTLLHDIDEMIPKDRANFWNILKEYEQAKLQRTTAAPYKHDNQEIKLILVTANEQIEQLNEPTNNTDISKDV